MPANATRQGSSTAQTSASFANVRNHVFSTLATIDELGDQNDETAPSPSSITQMPSDSVVTLSVSSSLQTSGQSLSDDLSTVEEFFSDDNGQRLLPDTSSLDEAPALGSPLTLVPSIGSVSSRLSRVSTWHSKFSVDTVVDDDSSVRVFTLEEVCQVIDTHRSMQYAQIVSAEGYKEWTGTVVHRYIVLELRRDVRKTIWLRIDRRRSRKVNMLTFLANGATTPANDVAKLSATKSKLIVSGQLETIQTFAVTPTLGDLRHLFRVIRDELQRYQLWPANCWFFVSLLHQHLGFTGDGVFLQGSLPNPKLARSIRETVKQRMCLLYRIPDPETLAKNIGVSGVQGAPYTRIDDVYREVILQHVDPTNIQSLNQFWSITALILCAQEALPLLILVQLVLFKTYPASGTQTRQRNMTRLALLFTGTHKHDVPIKKPHPSFTAFISDPARSGLFSIDIQMANEEIAFVCLRIIQSELHFNICQLPTSFKAKQDLKNVYDPHSYITPQVLYACQHLIHHITRLTTINYGITEGISYFLRGRFLSWLEVMSVTSSPFAAALRLLNLWVVRVSPISDVAALIRDAMDFVQTFEEPITQSATHIYLTALSFAPTHSQIHKHYFHLFPGINASLRGRVSTWSNFDANLNLPEQGPIRSVAFSPDGTRIVSGSEDGEVQLWDARTGAKIGEPTKGHTGGITSVAFSPDNAQVVSGSDDHTLRLWDAKTRASIGKPLQGHTNRVESAAFSPDGAQVVSCSGDRTLRLWDAKTGASVGKPLLGHTDWVRSVAFTPDGKKIVSGSDDHSLQLWDTRTGASVGKPLRGHSYWVLSVAFSPDGTRLVSGSADCTLRLWDVKTGASIGEPLRGHTGMVVSIAFSPNGMQIVSGSYDRTLRFWDARSGANIGEPLSGHTNWIMSVAFSPDGRQVVSGSYDGTIRLWNVTTGDDRRGTIWPSKGSALDRDNLTRVDLQYPPKLFPLGYMHISEGGWILGPNNELLIWVPPFHRRGLKNSDTYIIFGIPQTELDFHKFKCGVEWAQCRDPTLTRTLPIT